MTKHCLARIGVDVFVNFYEVASVESLGDNDVLIVLKNGHKIEVSNTTPAVVNFCLAAHIAYMNHATNDIGAYGETSYRSAMNDGYDDVRERDGHTFRHGLKW